MENKRTETKKGELFFLCFNDIMKFIRTINLITIFFYYKIGWTTLKSIIAVLINYSFIFGTHHN